MNKNSNNIWHKAKRNDIGWSGGRGNHSSILPLSGEFLHHHSISKKRRMSSLWSPINEEQRERGQKRGSFKRGAIPMPTSVPYKHPLSHSFFLVVHIEGAPALGQVLCSTLNNLPVGFQCVFQQQKSTTPDKDQRKFRFGYTPEVGLAKGQPTPPWPTPETEVGHCPEFDAGRDFSLGSNFSLGSEGYWPYSHRERLPSFSASLPSSGKVKLAASGKRGTGGIRQAQHPQPAFSAPTPLATE